ncbi:MAG TPA: hypothetical protein VMI30_07415 [Stellaceae bacterium]|nr:hypothetical protein [Stellaceae bacterium]
MALTFRRRRIQPMPTARRTAEMVMRRGDPISPMSDDYLVEGTEEPARPSTGAQVAHFLQIVMIFVMAVLSFAIFWLVGIAFNIF